MSKNRSSVKRGLAAWLPLVVLPLLVLVAGAGMLQRGSVEAATTIVVVGQTNGGGANGVNQYNAASITITRNDTVTWNSAVDGRAHDVTSGVIPGGAAAFQSATLDSDTGTNSFSRTLTVDGTYTYFCSFHSDATEATLANVDANIAAGRMVGKIVVQAPAADTTPPTVSGVAASPNPSAGAAGVALSATVGDNVAVTVARYRVDGGASVGMTVSGGTSATASIPTGALSLGLHTVDVQSEDAAGNVSAWTALAGGMTISGTPAGAVTASISIVGGGLNNTTSAVNLPAVTLSGVDQTSAASPVSPWNAIDARGTGLGWNVTMTSSNFTASGGTIAVANFKTRLTSVTTVAGNAAPAPTPASFTALSTATPLKILSAAVGDGMGSYTYSPEFQLTVPAATAPGSYTASIVVSINSGP